MSSKLVVRPQAVADLDDQALCPARMRKRLLQRWTRPSQAGVLTLNQALMAYILVAKPILFQLSSPNQRVSLSPRGYSAAYSIVPAA